MLRNVEKRRVHAARNVAGSNFGSVADIRTEMHGPWLIRSRFTCDPPPTDLSILGLFSIEIPGFSVLRCYLPMTKAKPEFGFVFQLDFAISRPNCKPFID